MSGTSLFYRYNRRWESDLRTNKRANLTRRWDLHTVFSLFHFPKIILRWWCLKYTCDISFFNISYIKRSIHIFINTVIYSIKNHQITRDAPLLNLAVHNSSWHCASICRKEIVVKKKRAWRLFSRELTYFKITYILYVSKHILYMFKLIAAA